MPMKLPQWETRFTKQATGKPQSVVLDMFRHQGDEYFTYYMPDVIREARERKGLIRIVGQDKKQNPCWVITIPRMVDRSNLLGTYQEPHEKAGQHKYVTNDSVSRNGKIVTGANNVNPFLLEHRVWTAIVQTFQNTMHQNELRSMIADVHKSRLMGVHLKWRTQQPLCSPWMSQRELWKAALELHPNLRRILKQMKSHIQKVKRRGSGFQKFGDNLNLLRRARSLTFTLTGEHYEGAGGATPYAMPLEQAGMAIDMHWLTTDKDKNWEYGDYFYRLAIGRITPQLLSYYDWRGMDIADKRAYREESSRKELVA